MAALRPLLLDETVPTWLMIALAILTGAVLRFTVVGRNLYAVGDNAEAARLSGIPVDRYKMGAFVLNSAMAGIVGVLYAGRFNSVTPTVLTGTRAASRRRARRLQGRLTPASGQCLSGSPCRVQPGELRSAALSASRPCGTR